MSIVYTIQDRIEEQIKADLIASLEMAAKDVQRFNAGSQGNIPVADDAGELPLAWLLISVDDEEVELAMAETLVAERKLPVTVTAHLANRLPTGFNSTAQLGTHWKGLIEKGVTSNPQRTESGGTDLATETVTVGTCGPVIEERNREIVCGVEFEVIYQTRGNDPTQLYAGG